MERGSSKGEGLARGKGQGRGPPPAAHGLPLCAQAANGGGAFSDYSSSVPSTPSISQRELRIETIAASNTPTPIRKQSKRRSNIFTVSPGIRGGQARPPPKGWPRPL